MGTRGPQPTPTASLKLRGSWRGETRENEPEAPVSAPRCPECLEGAAKAEWKRIVPSLVARMTLSKDDLAALTVYCRAWGDFVGISQELAQNYVLTDERGRKSVNPLIATLYNVSDRLLKASDRFGLSPAAKTRVRAVAAGEAAKAKLDGFKIA